MATMITIPNKDFTSNINLSRVVGSTTKVNMLKVAKALDLYVSSNLKKDVTAERVAMELLENPIAILYSLCKNELQILDEFIKAGENQYIIRKQRKTYYKLQKYFLVLTYEDESKGEWYMIMPNTVRMALSASYKLYLEAAEKGSKGPSPKDLRMLSFMNQLCGE